MATAAKLVKTKKEAAKPEAEQPKVESSNEGSVVAPVESAPVKAKSGKTSITILIRKSQPSGPVGGSKRTFTLEQHGEDFMVIAEQYRVRFNGEVVE